MFLLRIARQHVDTTKLTTDLPAADDVESAVGIRGEIDRTIAALDCLSRDDRDIVALRFGAGLTNVEAAACIGMTSGQVAVRL